MVARFSVLCGLAYVLIASAVDIQHPTLDARQGPGGPPPPNNDPCANVGGGRRWVAPADLRACYTSFPVNETEKANIIEVITKTLAFHTSVNYEVLAPAPFSGDVHEDVLGDLQRISRQSYDSDFDLHLDLSRTLKRLNDGHCVYINDCYDSTFVSYLPTPLAVLTDSNGIQGVYIAPEAFTVASKEFSDEIQVWQDALPGHLNGQLASLSGAKVLLINGRDPWAAVNANAAMAGSYQGFGTRQNGFFSSYNAASTGWTYIMGQFAQQALPLADNVTLTLQLANSSKVDTVTLPYRARFGTTSKIFVDSTSFRRNNCVALPSTNGVKIPELRKREAAGVTPLAKFQQQPPVAPAEAARHPMDVILDTIPLEDVVLPSSLQPPSPLPGSSDVSQFYMFNTSAGEPTGVLALGSFSSTTLASLQNNLLVGLQNLQDEGAMQLIVDVTNNGGGFICAAHWLHRIIAGPKASTVPQAGLDTVTRDGPLAQLIVKSIIAGADPDNELIYNPQQWTFANNTPIPAGTDWLQPPVNKTINGRQDAFSQRLGQECQPFSQDAPAAPLFNSSRVVIVSNGRCASSCSLFSVTMAKEEGVKTVVIGGQQGVQQQYCGTVGGQSTDFSTIDSEVKTAGLKNNSLAPPDFLTNSIQGITWRLAFGVDEPDLPEEWQDHPADVNLPLTAATVNNPLAIWQQVAETVFSS